MASESAEEGPERTKQKKKAPKKEGAPKTNCVKGQQSRERFNRVPKGHDGVWPCKKLKDRGGKKGGGPSVKRGQGGTALLFNWLGRLAVRCKTKKGVSQRISY